MSTRAQVGFYRKNKKDFDDFEALLYHHSDGYPSYLFPDIAKFLIDFDANRGINDLEYAAANLIAYWRLGYSGCLTNKLECVEKLTRYTGLGISRNFHGDIEYFYAIYDDGMVEIYDVSYSKFNLIGKTSICVLSNLHEDLIQEFANAVENVDIESGDIYLTKE